MPHLVLPVHHRTAPNALRESLSAAHQFLVEAARETLPRLQQLPALNWGAAAKREHVAFPSGSRPDLVSAEIDRHSFAEVVNQCATLERLIDALTWVSGLAALQGAVVVTCNPTTSSSPRAATNYRPEDHDLVLKCAAGTSWKFEVSDVASDQDSNEKEVKDLTSLGLLPRAKSAHWPEWPSGRCHLVVSSEFASRLRDHKRHGVGAGKFHYLGVGACGDTRIFEVCPGRRPVNQ